MRIRRGTSRLLVEPPASATGDIAFNLIVFFLVCASVQPNSGRKQTLPKSEAVKQEQQQDENIEVMLTRQAVAINGDMVTIGQFNQRIRSMLSGKPRPEDKIVIVKSRKDVAYTHWIDVTSRIEDAGGIITLQLEEEREVLLPN
ncbi:MAG: biopolymer transporter ExbD [Planctomycetaceae bacterium]|nr:biopolymer transporter ExbD [Planctomycetaceae bacterium]